MKRVADLFLAVIILLLLHPVFIVLSILVKTKLGSPILFTQTRPGLNGKPFKLLKFRSMTDSVDDNGLLLPDEKRLTSFGKALRASSLDELPSLVNVIKGDMSFIGPRPLLMEYLPLYTAHQSRRHEVRPGITGWAQVNGRNAISWEKKFEFDVWYVDNKSFWLDIKIVILTVKKVFKKEGIASEGEATMSKFKGNQL